MDKDRSNMIFLSASIPDPKRNKKYFNTADIVAIRDSVRALATVIIPDFKLVWGGHPAISPMIRFVIEKMGSFANEHVILYQSKFFKNNYPEDNKFFEKVIFTEELEDREASLKLMRDEMLNSYSFKAGIFIGGMEGVEQEYELFKTLHPNATLFPVASTGGAAKLLFEESEFDFPTSLKTDYAYMSLFKTLIINQ